MVLSSVVEMDAFYTVLRYSPDPARDEARNIGILVVGDSRHAWFKTAPLSRVTPKLHEQGLLDAILARFESRVNEGEFRNPNQVSDLAAILRGPIQLTSPAPMAVAGSFQTSADALFHSLVAIRQRRGPGLGKGELLDRVVDVFRSKGAAVARGSYIGDFIFDAVVQDPGSVPTAVGVASFDTEAEDWAGTERQVGHYLFAVTRVQPRQAFVVQAPTSISTDAARLTHGRVTKWLHEAGVPTIPCADIPAFAARLAGGQLWLADALAGAAS
jgi:hypothetical protein